MKPQHTIAECNKKLTVLLEKLNEIDTTDPMLRFKVDDAKMLAQELSRESDYLTRHK